MDVAERAGVSVAAVSYALNGAPGVSEETRARILEAAEELEYRPNRIATSLRSGEAKVFGLMVPDLANPFSSELAAGVLRAASGGGYGVFVSQAEPGAPPGGSLDFLLEHQVAGLVLSSLVDQDHDLLVELLRRKVPIVQVIRRVEDVETDFVGIDDIAAGKVVIKHLVGLGRTDVAVIAGPQNSSAQRHRLDGYRAGLRKAGHALADIPARGG